MPESYSSPPHPCVDPPFPSLLVDTDVRSKTSRRTTSRWLDTHRCVGTSSTGRFSGLPGLAAHDGGTR